MTPQEVKQAIKNGKKVFFDDIEYHWSLGVKDRPQILTYQVYKAKGLNTYYLKLFKAIRHTKEGVKFECTKSVKKSQEKLKFNEPYKSYLLKIHIWQSFNWHWRRKL